MSSFAGRAIARSEQGGVRRSEEEEEEEEEEEQEERKKGDPRPETEVRGRRMVGGKKEGTTNGERGARCGRGPKGRTRQRDGTGRAVRPFTVLEFFLSWKYLARDV